MGNANIFPVLRAGSKRFTWFAISDRAVCPVLSVPYTKMRSTTSWTALAYPGFRP